MNGVYRQGGILISKLIKIESSEEFFSIFFIIHWESNCIQLQQKNSPYGMKNILLFSQDFW